ncbi:MAG: S24 family peptidase [Planctomycetaceae bacterium]|nr:S24 family peptidase [Planctomycetaceae bacterium]
MARPKKQRTPKTLFSKRLYRILGDKNIHEFENKYGLSSGQISRFFDGAEPRLSAIEAIVKGTGCRADWLLFGEGEPFGSGQGREDIIDSPPKHNAERWNEEIPFVRPDSLQIVGEAAADETQGSRAGVFGEDDRAIWDAVDIPPTTRMVRIIGDSMSPVLLDGQYAMVGEEYPEGKITENREIVVAQVTDGLMDFSPVDSHWEGVYCKRVVDSGDTWLFLSINPVGAPFTVAKSNCRLWPVIGVWFGGHGRPPAED